jgi:hypothetical protein
LKFCDCLGWFQRGRWRRRIFFLLERGDLGGWDFDYTLTGLKPHDCAVVVVAFSMDAEACGQYDVLASRGRDGNREKAQN